MKLLRDDDYDNRGVASEMFVASTAWTLSMDVIG